VKLSSRSRKILNVLGIIFLFGLGIFARSNMSNMNGDVANHFVVWYDFIQSEGIMKALRYPFSIYTPFYTYLLSLATLTYPYLDKVTAIKLIPVTADVVNVYLVYKIVRLKYPAGLIPFWAAGAFFCLPTVFVNSAIWGQTDALYTVFLLACLYFVLREKPFWGMLAYAFSFAIKLQSIVFAPFLIILLLKKRVKWWHFILIPIVYVLLCIPVILLGRGKRDVLTIYLGQADLMPWLSGNAPNLFSFIPDKYYHPGLYIALAVAALGIGAWIILTVRSKIPLDRNRLVLIALVTVALTPFLLPKMHERYFYSENIFALIAAFFFPEMWFVPIASQVSSLLAYWRYFNDIPSLTIVYIGAIINTALLTFLLWKQFSPRQEKEDTVLLPNRDLGANNIL